MAERKIINPGEHPYQYGQSLPLQPPEQPPITEMDWRKVRTAPVVQDSTAKRRTERCDRVVRSVLLRQTPVVRRTHSHTDV